MAARAWWRDGVLYQLYPRSFADCDGDGIGDLRGIIDHLDHLAWLGIDGLWLNPTFPSPNADWGFDVADYRDVHPDLGTLADLEDADRGRRRARHPRPARPRPEPHERRAPVVRRGARRPRRAAPRLVRVARPGPGRRAAEQLAEPLRRPGVGAGRRDGPVVPAHVPPQAAGPELVERRGPRRVRGDPRLLVRPRRRRLPDRRRERDRQGPRAARQPAVRDRRTTTRASARSASAPSTRLNQPEVHDVFRRWRALGAAPRPRAAPARRDGRPRPRARSCASTATDDGLQLALNFLFLDAALDATALAAVVARTEAPAARRRVAVWTASNHDVVRFPTRWAQGDERRIRLALMLLLTLRGTPILYYGDEIGMPGGRDPRRPRPRPGRPARGQRRAGPRRRADPDAVDGRAGRRVHRRRRRAVAAVRRPRRQRRRPARRPRLGPPPGPRPHRAAARRRRAPRRPVHAARRAGRRVGLPPGRPRRGRAQPLGCGRSSCRG